MNGHVLRQDSFLLTVLECRIVSRTQQMFNGLHMLNDLTGDRMHQEMKRLAEHRTICIWSLSNLLNTSRLHWRRC